MDVFVILQPSNGKGLKRITRATSKTKIFAKLQFRRGKLSSHRKKERKNKVKNVRYESMKPLGIPRRE